MKHIINKNPRIEVVDALRGFAVMAIVLVHNLEHFIFPVYPTNYPTWLNIVDQGVFNCIFTLFAGKAYAIFALLFGFTFYIQSNNQRKQGKDFGYRFLWRMVLLVGFATLNAAFFPAGDVLLLFAIVGLVLFFTRNWSDKAILISSVIFLLQPIEWFHYIASLINPAHQLPDLGVGAMYAEVAEYTKAGNLWNFIIGNITLGQKASLLWAVNAGRFVQTAGLFLLGCYIGRKQLFIATEQNLRFWVKVLIIAAISFAPLYSLSELMIESNMIIQQTARTAFDMWQKLAFTFVLVASFVLLYQRERFVNAVSGLRFYGRMSLTNYITQSIIGAAIYFPFGLYLAPYCGYTISLLIGIFVFLLQVKGCQWWLSKHKQGPFEHIWHKWTWIGDEKINHQSQ
ncbi:uncharacterized protein M2459_001669 [Parabacteroides sp. PF5-5]|uniref:DUF418 domain-containing protein n=1 Tax=unclassified Parabacteroides TaxID=2649774 RepID=UPI002473C804|nr:MULTISPECIES: DUF418 domain-containing protein [unclassified Parabacteroides]MDH6304932.1 uncharacterized protein [Parabacteroides sp. PH5-39]MDH6315982.1 uncharacterized protein [Parabacteroides sp. PF5-13]MDH6319639.1 uncharacterized protein [Parabacteroides sp. PH5-13]MDH6323370.1 uncharacterized protein [Parabacteroides sp. PH5-8]MDH6327121.1 uncharacterized protein [Parabacteroides sp. PH5-41]